jgi:carbamoyl-phosphate synthase large subunit
LKLPLSGKAFISVTNADKGQAVILARRLNKLGFDLVATYGTATRLHEVGLECESVFKVNEGRPNIADLIRQGDIALIINTPLGKVSHYDEKAIRKAALQFNVPCVTTITGAEALVEAISTKKSQERVLVRSLQEIHSTKQRAAEESQ